MGKKLTIQDLKDRGLILYHYLRGSQSYGLATKDSDMDYGIVYACPPEQLLGLGLDFQDEILEDNNNICAFSLKKFALLLVKSNPTILEALFISGEHVLYEHPIITDLKKHRYEFLTQACFPAFSGYAKSQYKNATNTKKKVYNPVTERLDLLSFVYTFHKQGSSKLTNWLTYRHLRQEFCGVCKIPNASEAYGLYYDFGSQFQAENITADDLVKAYQDTTEYDTIKIVNDMKTAKECGDEELTKQKEKELDKASFKNMVSFIISYNKWDNLDNIETRLAEWYEQHKEPIGYRGMVRILEDGSEDRESNELRMSSISKGEEPICHIFYNDRAYSQHCHDYHSYTEWFRNKNEHRWEKTMVKGYDHKAMCSALRIIRLAIGICEDKEFYLDRTNIDREYLLQVKNGELSLEEVLTTLKQDIDHMEKSMDSSDLSENIDVDWLNDWLLRVQSQFVREWLEK